jgi:ubiquinone biosynthesis protein
MGISLRPEHLKRYAAIARLLIRHGRSDWAQQIGIDSQAGSAAESDETPPNDLATELANDLEKLGPTFVKLGQLVSSRADLLPPAYLAALSRLQDSVGQFPFEQVEQIVTTELGMRLSRAFETFERTPLAAASLGQVHRATLRDGRNVVVKVQRPDIRERIATDFDALEEIAEFLDRHTDTGRRIGLQRLLVELRRTIFNELDYRVEASNLRLFAANLREFPRIVVPEPIEDYCSARVLTMGEIQGAKITSISPVVLTEIDRSGLAEELFRAYLKQVLADGLFHADPHPGNVYLTHDHKIALLDLGMVSHLSPGLQQELLKLLLAVSEGRGDDAADITLRASEQLENFDRTEFRRRVADFVAQQQNVRVGQIQAGRLVLEIQRIAVETGVRVPQGFTMLGKALLNLDRVAHVLDPDFDPNASIRRNAMEVLRRQLTKSITLGGTLQALLETGDFVQKLPQRLSGVLDMLGGREFKLSVDAIDEAQLLRGIHKVANRITAGLVLAALIVGAALLMRIETPFKLWGYPGLAMLLFLAAAAGGMVMVVRILWRDYWDEAEARMHGRRGPH